MKYFLALRLADSTKARLAAVATRMQAWELPARWVHSDDFHITVAHLGTLDETEVRAVSWAVEDVASSLLPAEFHLPGIGAFGGKHEPRVVYAAVEDGGYCTDLHTDLQDALGERPEANFKPHITLCRPHSGRHLSMGRSWKDLFLAMGQMDMGTCGVLGLTLHATDPQGFQRYRPIDTWPLSRKAASGLKNITPPRTRAFQRKAREGVSARGACEHI